MATSIQILNKARECIGIKESPPDSNNVIFNTDYYGKAVSGAAYPWCVTFIYFLFKAVGASHLFYDGKKTALCATLGNWFKSKNQFFSTPKIGDIVFFKTSRTKNWTNHVGIVEAINTDNTITTIEGNTSLTNNDNGGAVMRRTRSLSGKDCFIVGFGRPAYSDSSISVASSAPTTLSLLLNLQRKLQKILKSLLLMVLQSRLPKRLLSLLHQRKLLSLKQEQLLLTILRARAKLSLKPLLSQTSLIHSL